MECVLAYIHHSLPSLSSRYSNFLTIKGDIVQEKVLYTSSLHENIKVKYVAQVYVRTEKSFHKFVIRIYEFLKNLLTIFGKEDKTLLFILALFILNLLTQNCKQPRQTSGITFLFTRQSVVHLIRVFTKVPHKIAEYVTEPQQGLL